MDRKKVLPNLRYCLGICLRRLTSSTNGLSDVSWCSGRDSNRVSAENNSKTLTLEFRCFLKSVSGTLLTPEIKILKLHFVSIFFACCRRSASKGVDTC